VDITPENYYINALPPYSGIMSVQQITTDIFNFRSK